MITSINICRTAQQKDHEATQTTSSDIRLPCGGHYYHHTLPLLQPEIFNFRTSVEKS